MSKDAGGASGLTALDALEARPNLEAVRTLLHADAEVPIASRPARVRRRSLLLASASAVAALTVAWFGVPEPFAPAVAAQVRFEVWLAEPDPAPGLQVASVGNWRRSSGELVH